MTKPQEPVTLNRTFEILVNGETREVFMSFALLNELARMVGAIENIGNVIVDFDLRDNFVSALLSERLKTGKKVSEFDLSEADIDPHALVDLIEWAIEWVVDFFIRQGEAAKRVMEKNQDRVTSLMSSRGGSQV